MVEKWNKESAKRRESEKASDESKQLHFCRHTFVYTSISSNAFEFVSCMLTMYTASTTLYEYKHTPDSYKSCTTSKFICCHLLNSVAIVWDFIFVSHTLNAYTHFSLFFAYVVNQKKEKNTRQESKKKRNVPSFPLRNSRIILSL